MKHLSYWAYLNPVKSQIIIALSHIMLGALAIYFGVWLFACDILLPKTLMYAGMTLFFIGFSFYPIRRARHKWWKFSYTKQKSMDALLVSGYMLMVITATNMEARAAWMNRPQEYRAQKVVMKLGAQHNSLTAKESGSWSPREINKTLKRKFRDFVSETRLEARNPDNNAGKIAGLVILMILLMLLVLVLACAVGCNGSGAGAFFIWIGGWTLILLLIIPAIRRLKGKRNTRYEP